MADPTFDGYEALAEPATPGLFGAVVHWTGAALSLGLLGGLVVWGYQLSTRDVSEVPVIEAIKGPMRERSADPGGDLALTHGLAVNRVQAEGTVAPPAERIVLATPPLDLSDEDRVAVAVLRARNSEGAPIIERPAAEAGQAGAETGEDTAEAGGTETARAVAEDADTAGAAGEAGRIEIIPASVPGVSRSPRPAMRPAIAPDQLEQMRAAIAARATDTAAPAFREIDAATLPDGTRLVQLGAHEDPEAARTEWKRLLASHGDLLSGKALVIQRAESGGRVFFRLRAAGFEDAGAARHLCTALRNRNTECISVTVR